MNTRNLFVSIFLIVNLLLSACASSANPDPTTKPSGIWEGAQEAGDTDWSMTLDFDSCAQDKPCAKVYYVLCAGEFVFQKEEKGTLVFQENITEHPDQCFSGATVQVAYQGQDKPMTVSWLADDGSVFTSAEMHYQDPAARPVIEGLGEQVALFRNMGAVNWGFVAMDGELWIPESNRGTVSRIDIASGKFLATIDVGDPAKPSYNVDPNVVAVSGNDVWVTQRADKAVARIDPSTNQVVDTIAVGVEPFNIAIDGNVLWVTAYDEGAVLKVDLQTKETLARIDIGAPSDIALINGMLWVAEHREGNVVLVDPQTAAVVERISLPEGSRPCFVTYFDDSVWVANRTGNSVSRIDPNTKDVMNISLPQNAAQLTVGGGFIWVALVPGPDGEMDLSKYAIAKIDPKTNSVASIIPFHGATNLGYSDGILWVDNRNDMSGDKLHAIQLEP